MVTAGTFWTAMYNKVVCTDCTLIVGTTLSSTVLIPCGKQLLPLDGFVEAHERDAAELVLSGYLRLRELREGQPSLCCLCGERIPKTSSQVEDRRVECGYQQLWAE